MSNPTLAPRISNSALVVMVVPWAKKPICAGGTPLAMNLATPSSTPSAGFFGVLATFSTLSSPVAVLSSTTSVWGPPTSTPSRQRALLMPDARLHMLSMWRKRTARKHERDGGSLHCPCSLDYDGSSTVGLEHVAGDDHLHHLARALGDAVAALLPPHLLDRKIGGERDAAVDLHALVGGLERHFVGVIFGHVGVLARLFALIEARPGLIDEEPRGL